MSKIGRTQVMGYPRALRITRGGSMAAERGILMRSGEAFEIFGELTWMVLDETGTITEGKPAVTDVVAPSGAADALRATEREGMEASLMRQRERAEATDSENFGLRGQVAPSSGGLVEAQQQIAELRQRFDTSLTQH